MTDNTVFTINKYADFEESMQEAYEVCQKDPIAGIHLATTVYEECKKRFGDRVKALYLLTVGQGYDVSNEIEKAFQSFQEALEIYNRLNDIERIIQTTNSIGKCYSIRGKYDLAIKEHFKALAICKENKLQKLESKTYTYLGSTFSNLHKREEAIKYFKKALVHSVNGRAIALSNLASVYCNSQQYEQALEYLSEAHQLRVGTSPLQYGFILSNLITVLTELLHFEDILSLIPEMVELKITLKDTIFHTLYNSSLIGTCLRCMENSEDEAAQKLLKAINRKQICADLKEIIETSEHISNKINTCELLAVYYDYEEDWKAVSDFQSKLIELKTQEYETEKMEAIEQLHIQHEVSQKEQKIKIQELELAKKAVELEKKAVELEKKKELEQINLQLEEKVAKRTAKLTLQNQQLQEFAFIVSHDLREPLCNIHGISDLLTNTYQEGLSDEFQLFLSQIGRSAERMNILLKDLLDYTVLEQKMEKQGFEVVNSSQLLSSVIDVLQSQIIESKASISISNLPIFKTSKYGLHLLFEQFLSNALQFKSTQHPCTIQISCTEHFDSYKFIFKDNGIGIEEAYLEEIFRPFRRLKREEKSTGIGLAICKKTVQTLGGSISVKSQLGMGSTFYFQLPKS